MEYNAEENIEVEIQDEQSMEDKIEDNKEEKPIDSINLARNMSQEDLDKIATDVINGFEIDKASMEEYLKRVSNWMRLSSVEPEVLNKKNITGDSMSNIVIPMLSLASVQFKSHVSSAVFSEPQLFKGIPIGYELDDTKKAERVAKYIDFLYNYKDKDQYDIFGQTINSLGIVGTAFRKAWYDPMEERVRIDFVKPGNMIINYYAKESKYTRKTEILKINGIQLQEQIDNNVFLELKQTSNESENNQETMAPIIVDASIVDEKMNEIKGFSKPSSPDMFTDRDILEQHTWIKYKGKNIPAIVWVDKESSSVLRIVSRRKGKKGVQEYYTKYVMIQDPNGSYFGIGFGLLLERINEGANTLINQIIDGGTYANSQSGFYLKGKGINGGDIVLKKGVYKPIELIGARNINEVVFDKNFKEPSGTLFNLLALLEKYSNRLSVSEAMTGELPRSGTGSTAVTQVLEQGLKVFTDVQRGFHKTLSKEACIVVDLLKEYLNEEEYKTIVVNKDAQGSKDGKTIPDEANPVKFILSQPSKEDFDSILDIQLVSDPNVLSKAMQASKADLRLKTIQSVPVASQNVEVQYRALKQFLQDIGDNEASISMLLEPLQESIIIMQQQREQQKVALEQQQQALSQQQSILGMTQQYINAGIIPPTELQTAVTSIAPQQQQQIPQDNAGQIQQPMV